MDNKTKIKYTNIISEYDNNNNMNGIIVKN